LLLLSGSTENELLRQEESRQHCASRPSGPNPFGRYIIPAGPPSQRRRSLWKIGGAPVAYPVASLFLWKCLTPRHQRHKREKWKVGGVDWAGNDAQSQLCHWSITFESNFPMAIIKTTGIFLIYKRESIKNGMEIIKHFHWLYVHKSGKKWFYSSSAKERI
jgi:hypothetical protein